MNPPIGLWLPRFSPSAGNIRSPASSTPSPPPPGPWGPRPFTFPCPFCAPCPRRNALPSPPWVPPAIPLRRPWRPRHWGPPIFWPDIFLTPAASRACPGGDWISWPRSAPLSPCLFTPLAASRRKLSPGVRRAGARGACFRSGFMTCPDPASYLHTLERSFSHAISP